MYKIVFTQAAIEDLGTFMDSFLKSKLSIIEDSGIDDSIFIRENYIKNSEALESKILSEILSRSATDIIGKMKSEKGMFFSIQIASFRILIHYFEDTSSKIRYIHSLEFYRK